MMHALLAALLIAVLASVGPVGAETETAESHADRPQKVVAIGQSRIVPTTLRMSTGDVLAFQNHSARIMRIVFLEPKNLGEKVRCGQIQRISEDEAQVPGALFKRRGDQVVGLIAPGAFVSVCSLAPGRYVYTVAPAAPSSGASAGEPLGQKGEIVVE